MQERFDRDGWSGGRGVSHVVGVVLLVAIAVLLVSVMAVFATGFGGDLEDPVQNFATTTQYNDSFANNGQYLNITHRSGTNFDTDSLRLDVNGAESVDAGGVRKPAQPEDDVIAGQVGDEFRATDTIVVNRSSFTDADGNLAPGKNVDLSDSTVRIVYDPGAGEKSYTLYECRPAVPDCEQSPA